MAMYCLSTSTSTLLVLNVHIPVRSEGLLHSQIHTTGSLDHQNPASECSFNCSVVRNKTSTLQLSTLRPSLVCSLQPSCTFCGLRRVCYSGRSSGRKLHILCWLFPSKVFESWQLQIAAFQSVRAGCMSHNPPLLEPPTMLSSHLHEVEAAYEALKPPK
jgi:hypothetical protein